jgi:hypothetical protein
VKNAHQGGYREKSKVKSKDTSEELQPDKNERSLRSKKQKYNTNAYPRRGKKKIYSE